MTQGLTLDQIQSMGGTPVQADTTSLQSSPAPSSGQGMTLAQLQNMGATPTPPSGYNPIQGAIRGAKNFFGDMGNAASSGINQIESGFQEFSNAGANPFEMLEGGLKGASGAMSTVLSPLAPLFSPLSKLINYTGDKISDSKAIQDFANSPAGKIIARAAQDISDLSNVAGGEAGIEAAPEAGAKVLEEPTTEGASEPTTGTNPTSEETMNPSADAERQARYEQGKADVANAYKSSMPLTPLEQAKEATLLANTGDNVYTTLAHYNISPANPDAISQLQSLSDMFRNATDLAKKNEGNQFNLSEIQNNALGNIMDSLSSATDRQSATSKLNDEIDALRQENPTKFIKRTDGQEVVPSEIVERLRKTGNDWAKYGKNKFNPDSVKEQTGRALGNAVRDQVEKEGSFPAYREANSQWGKVIHAQQILENIADKGKTFKAPGGINGTIARKVLSGMFGFKTGGIAGAVLAELGSELGAKVLSNPDFRTYFDRRIIEMSKDGGVVPKEVKALTDQVKAHIEAQEKLPRLPPPTSKGFTMTREGMKPNDSTFTGSTELGTPKGQPSDMPVTRPAKAVSIKNPKTGKYERAYTSEPKLSDKMIQEKYDYDPVAKKYKPKIIPSSK